MIQPTIDIAQKMGRLPNREVKNTVLHGGAMPYPSV
jgi:hypothetical protein